MSPAEPAFFNRSSTKAAIQALAEATELTVLVGAGVPVESGLPSWRSLVTALLESVGKTLGVPDSDLEAFVRRNLEDGLPSAGAVAKAWLGADFESTTRAELYKGATGGPGPTAREIARLRGAAGPSCEIVTTNYDDLLERALRESRFVKDPVRPYISSTKPKQAAAVVRHLHGILTPTRTEGRVVLSEADYHLMQDGRRWQEAYFRERLKRTSCLYLGTTLSDPNLVRYLYRSSSGPEHFAVFVRQADDWTDGTENPSLRTFREKATFKRWVRMNVTPLQADYFVQSAQFVHEVARARTLGSNYEPYAARLKRWEKGMRPLLETSPKEYAHFQDLLYTLVAKWLKEVEQQLANASLTVDGESFGLHLWVRAPKQHALVRLASSTRAWRDPRTVHWVRITRPTSWVAVEAFCAGVPLNQTAVNPHSRWRYVQGVPVILDDENWGRLPVGVLTLASTAADPVSALARAPSALTDEISTYLSKNAAELLTPPD